MIKLGLKRRKHKKGGNGNEESISSSSSQVSFDELYGLSHLIIRCNMDIIDISEDENEDQTRLNDLEEIIKEATNLIISIFRNNKFDLSTLSTYESNLLLSDIIITDKKIAEAYANAYLKLMNRDRNIIEIENIITTVNIFKTRIERDGENRYGHKKKSIENLNIIINILNIPINAITLHKASFLNKTKDPGPNALSTKRGLLPDNITRDTMEFLHGPKYRKQSSDPVLFSNVLENAELFAASTPNLRKQQNNLLSNDLRSRKRSRSRNRKRSRSRSITSRITRSITSRITRSKSKSKTNRIKSKTNKRKSIRRTNRRK
jgi:hypothetical protein